MEARDDVALVAAAAEADLDAYGELIRRHQDFVYGVVLRVVRNPTTAEDLAQETFVRAYRALGNFRGDSQVRSWLYRIANNLALNAVTRRREFPTHELPERKQPGGPEGSVELAAMRSAMRAAIENLPVDLREPLVLREFDHLSYEDIAGKLEIPINTVRTRIYRAKRALQSQMEEWR